MLRAVVTAFAILTMVGIANADPLYGLFDYQKAEPPVSGDCAAVAAKVGPEATWYGEFAGNRVDDINYRSPHAFAARGCFPSEYACRVWQNVAISYLRGGPVFYTRCQRGARGY
jgi:hypothetical protein